jgi:hypothetical protein
MPKQMEKNRARCEWTKPKWVKPKIPAMEKPIPKPNEESEGNEEMEEDEDEEVEDVESSAIVTRQNV